MLTAKSVGVFEICRVSEPWLMADRAGTHGPVSSDGICVTDTVFGVADAGAVPGAAQAAVLSVTMAAIAATAPRVHRGVRDDISGALHQQAGGVGGACCSEGTDATLRGQGAHAEW
jgi:hypothetical protein